MVRDACSLSVRRRDLAADGASVDGQLKPIEMSFELVVQFRVNDGKPRRQWTRIALPQILQVRQQHRFRLRTRFHHQVDPQPCFAIFRTFHLVDILHPFQALDVRLEADAEVAAKCFHVRGVDVAVGRRQLEVFRQTLVEP